jgi:hypothetical protein
MSDVTPSAAAAQLAIPTTSPGRAVRVMPGEYAGFRKYRTVN